MDSTRLFELPTRREKLFCRRKKLSLGSFLQIVSYQLLQSQIKSKTVNITVYISWYTYTHTHARARIRRHTHKLEREISLISFKRKSSKTLGN